MRGFPRSRSSQREQQSCEEAEQIMARLSPFGGGGAHNPVKDQIDDLRSLRDAGRMSTADYAATVADLLGTSESAFG
jgi:hypothetical protein